MLVDIFEYFTLHSKHCQTSLTSLTLSLTALMLWLLVKQRLPHGQGTVLGWEATCFMISRRIYNLIIIILWINFGDCHQPSLGAAAGHVLVEYSPLAPGAVCIGVFAEPRYNPTS